MSQEEADPGVRGIRRAVKKHVNRHPDLRAAFGVRGCDVVQKRALEEIRYPVYMDELQVIMLARRVFGRVTAA